MTTATSTVDSLDLMRDEFKRIRSCPGATTEIQGLCDRAISGIERKVPLIIEAESLRNQLHSIAAALLSLQRWSQSPFGTAMATEPDDEWCQWQEVEELAKQIVFAREG